MALNIRILVFAAAALASYAFFFYHIWGNGPHTAFSSALTSAFQSHGNKDGLAYMTLMAGTMLNVSDPDISNDKYFVATRLLGYQLMHAPTTKTRKKIPFVVLVTDKIPMAVRERLQKDGATVILVEDVHTESDWAKSETPEWADVMTKLRAWQMTQYSRVLLLDADMVLSSCLDGVFTDPAAQIIPLVSSASSPTDEGELPDKYLFASFPEANPHHAYPPTVENNDFKDPNYFNAGFFIFAPSQQMYRHYYAILSIENRFDPRYPEQNLLNYAHHREGKMPWQLLDLHWNIRFPNKDDLDKGVASMHDKWWHAQMDGRLEPYFMSLRWRMEGFYEAIDAGLMLR
ncbi:hypothetical protein V491_05426 [Pseudogymnoascus sp. VKM F-3775]|nr:hypothetical protein V491_05426 [Pseudogymnoascus sp. VKM F-3775]